MIDIVKINVGIKIPIINANKIGFMKLRKTVGKIESAVNWFPRYTDNIAATGTDDTKIPNNIPMEHEIAIPAKLIKSDSEVWTKTYSGRIPIVNPSTINPNMREIPVAIIKQK